MVIKPETDPRSYRVVTLPNQLKLCVVSNPEEKLAAAALQVRVGSLNDREFRVQGLAHFCEHMLFLGTDKYPDDNEYSTFLAQHGGSCNASTSDDATVYHFVVAPSALDGALDRFAEFFLTPQFTESATDRELNAIDNEHRKNLANDRRRQMQLFRDAADLKHPLHHFRTGSVETLRDQPLQNGINVREALVAFHKRWYSANRMSLAVCGPQSLEELEGMVTPLFSGIADKDVQDAVFPPQAFSSLPTLQYNRPVVEGRSVRFEFVGSDKQAKWRTAPAEYWGHLLGHEGPGSIYALLNARGLATALSAGECYTGGGIAVFVVNIQVTELGAQDAGVLEMGDVLFAYINMARANGVQHWVWQETKELKDLAFRFRATPDPDDLVEDLVEAMSLKYPDANLLNASSCRLDFCVEDLEWQLSELTVDNLRVAVMYPEAPSCTKTEHFYGTLHSPVLPLPDDWRQRWGSVTASDFPVALPKPNPFITRDFALRGLCLAEPSLYPTLLCEGPGQRCFFLQDSTFRTPKVCAKIAVYSHWVAESALNHVLTDIWARCVKEDINEVAYDLELAGLAFEIEDHSTGLMVYLHGYPDQLLRGVDLLFSKAVVTDHAFKVVMVRVEKYFKKECYGSQAHEYANEWLNTALLLHFKADAASLAALPSVTLEAVRAVPDRVREQAYVESLVQGNCTDAEATALTARIASHFAGLPPKQLPRRAIAVLDGHTVRHAAMPRGDDPNEAICVYLQLGKATPETRATTQVILAIFKNEFFAELRTRQQLGYIVSARMSELCGVVGVRLRVQSGTYKVPHLSAAVLAFLQSMQTFVADMSDETLEEYISGVISELEDEQGPKRLTEEFTRNWDAVWTRRHDFAWRVEALDYLRTLRKNDFELAWHAFLAAPSFAVHVGLDGDWAPTLHPANSLSAVDCVVPTQ